MKLFLRIVGFALLLSGFFASAHGATADAGSGRGTPVGTVMVPDGLSAETVQKAILLAGSGRGWTVKQKSDGEVVLFLEQEKWRSTMTATYTAHEVSLFSNSTKSNKPKIPEGWIKYLKQDITKELGTAAFAK